MANKPEECYHRYYDFAQPGVPQLQRRLAQMGYLRGVVHGAMVGACVGLLYAPESGIVARRRVVRWLQQVEGILAGTGSVSEVRRAGARTQPSVGQGVGTRAKRP